MDGASSQNLNDPSTSYGGPSARKVFSSLAFIFYPWPDRMLFWKKMNKKCNMKLIGLKSLFVEDRCSENLS